MVGSLDATAGYTGDIAQHIRDTVAQQVRDAHPDRVAPGDVLLGDLEAAPTGGHQPND
jgi:hypothetical protein